MAGYTDEYGLQTLSTGDDWTANGYKFSDADRKTISRLLKIGAETHHHTGLAASEAEDEFELDFEVVETAGSIPAGQRVFYKYTLVDEFGFESAASAEYFVDTPAAIVEPSSPTLATLPTGGVLLPGNYYYVLTAYTNVNTQETRAIAPAYITVPSGTSTNRVTITYPSLPAGADGWNIYRKKPGGVRYDFLVSVASGPTSYSDTGAVAEDCNRTIPSRNLTNAQNTVVVTLDDSTLAEGITWKLYRSYNQNYEDSLLHHVVEETFEESGIITQEYQDTGTATSSGSPPVASQAIGTPSKILLTAGAEVQGLLPRANVTGFPYQLSFIRSGLVAVNVGTEVWCCEFPAFTIVGCRASLGRGRYAASADVIVDINKDNGAATPTFGTIYTTQANRPRITFGQQQGVRTVPNIVELVEGDLLTMDVDQASGGATPTDYDLTVTVYGYAHGY